MRNAVKYAGMWLMPNSLAKDLHDRWKSNPSSINKKSLDDHIKMVNENFERITYPKTSKA